MKLAELEPQWLERDGNRVGLMFRCPHCRDTWLTVFWVGMRIWGEETARERGNWEGQFGFIRLALDRLKLMDVPENAVVPCEEMLAWTRTGDTFENLSLSPSLNAERAGHWHGFITNGEIR